MAAYYPHCWTSSRIEYAKKKDKKQLIKFTKDETIHKDDVYKSHVVTVPSGEPPGSLSRPAAKRKPGQVRPITQGKLLRKGGPSTDVGLFIASTVPQRAYQIPQTSLDPLLNQRPSRCLEAVQMSSQWAGGLALLLLLLLDTPFLLPHRRPHLLPPNRMCHYTKHCLTSWAKKARCR